MKRHLKNSGIEILKGYQNFTHHCLEANTIDLKTQKPKVFIGSSKETLKYAVAIKAKLKRVASLHIWDDDIWRLGKTTLENLIDLLPRYDFAVLILGADDITSSRGRVTPSPRDNIIFELGLFMGHLGRFRTFFLCRKDTKLKIPSNLNGIIYPSFEETPDQPNKAVAGACKTIRQEIKTQGVHKLSQYGSGPFGEAVFNWMKNLSDAARTKLGKSQFIQIGKTREALMNLVDSAKVDHSILAICGYKKDYATEYYKKNFKNCKVVKRVFSYEAMCSEIKKKEKRYALNGLNLHRDKEATGDCDVEIVLIPKKKYIKHLGSGNFDPPLSFGLTILLDENNSPRKAVVHWEVGAKPLKHLIDIEGVIIDGEQKELLNELVKLHEEIAGSEFVLSSKNDKHKIIITALCAELEEIWKSQRRKRRGKA
jgi:predicted nucleotide-binding protein